MPGQSDLQLNRSIRRILVRHWVDLGRLSIRSTNGMVLVYGRLQRIAGREALTPPTVEAIFYDIRRLKDTRRIKPHLENWSNEGGLWRPVEDDKDSPDRDTAHVAFRPQG